MRVLLAGFMHESNTFGAVPADRSRFLEGSFACGADNEAIWRDAHHEFGGFIIGCEQHQLTIISSLMAWATPSGPVTDDVFEEVTAKIVSDIQQHRPDGVLLALHGAMVTKRYPSADSETIQRIRRALGPTRPLITTLDFHANVSTKMAEHSNALIGYQTYPHIDQRDRGLLAAELMKRTLAGEISPICVVAHRPMIANILGQDTTREPMKQLMKQARTAEQQPGILSVSLMGGFNYADVDCIGPSVIVVADVKPDLAIETANDLADELWKARQALYVPCLSPKDAVAKAKTSTDTPVILVDLGDNVGGGSAADGTVLLEEMLAQEVSRFLVLLFAPKAVQQCRQLGVGATFTGEVGGQVDHLHGQPVLVNGTIQSIHDGLWVETEARHGGRRHNDQGQTAVIAVEHGGIIVLNSLQTPPFSLGQITSLGIDPKAFQCIVVKAAVAYKAAYLPIAGSVIEVDTPGVTAVNPARFPYQHVPRPIYPIDPI